MKFSKNLTLTGAAFLAGFFPLMSAFAEDAAPPQKAQILLDQVKKSELNREIAAKQTAIDRLKEDLDKNKKDAEGLQQTINTTSDLVNDSTKRYEDLSAERKRLQHDLNLTLARMEAEGQRIEGLRNLGIAQGKALSALSRHIEETDVRSHLRQAEMQAMAEGKLIPGEEVDDKRHPDLYKLRKSLNTCEAKTDSEERLARTAMKSASTKVQAADLAAAHVQRMAEEPIADQTEAAPKKAVVVAKSVPKSNLKPEPIGEKPMDVKH